MMEDEDFKKECIHQLQECAKENGGYISTTIYRKSSRTPTSNRIISAFGNWNTAIKEAQLKTKDEYTQYCKDILTKFFSRYPSNPSEEMYDMYVKENKHLNYPTAKQITKALGRWRTVLKEMDLWERVLKACPKELCGEHLAKCASLNRGSITKKAYEEYREKSLKEDPFASIPTYEAIVDIYGTWKSATNDTSLSKLRGNLLLNYVQQDQEAKLNIQRKSEIHNPYFDPRLK